MSLIECPECHREISDKAPVCPHCGVPIAASQASDVTPPAPETGKRSHGCLWAGCILLVILFVIGLLVGLFGIPGRTTGPARAGLPAPASASPAPTVAILDWRMTEPSVFHVAAEGELKNLSSTTLENVLVAISLYDAKGNVLSSEGALIEKRQLSPGQTSPFKVIGTRNPAMVKVGLAVKNISGKPIPFVDQSK